MANEKFAQLEEIEQRCLKLQKGYKPSFAKFDQELIEGVVFFWPGHGWQLHDGWQLRLLEKLKKYPYQTSPPPNKRMHPNCYRSDIGGSEPEK